jgi:hypothetical protein
VDLAEVRKELVHEVRNDLGYLVEPAPMAGPRALLAQSRERFHGSRRCHHGGRHGQGHLPIRSKDDRRLDEEFCSTRSGVKFDMFAKVKVKGPGIDPLFACLTSPETTPKFSGDVKWNFNKFLVGKHGEVLARFEPKVDPTSPEVKAAIEAALAS